MNQPVETTPSFCVAQWRDSDQAAFAGWMEKLRHTADEQKDTLHPLLQDFRNSVERVPGLFVQINQMFEQLPSSPQYQQDPTGKPQVRDFLHLLQMINVVLTAPPQFNQTGITGLPINAMLAWPMGTLSGYGVFLRPEVNVHIKRILQQWGSFLRSPASLPALSDDPASGWFGAQAMANMPGFDELYECDPALTYRGFASWDDIFLHGVFAQAGARSARPTTMASSSMPASRRPTGLARNVGLIDRFWIKAQPYSLQHMLDSDALAAQFDGGTVYQAFLSSFSYHRWHSPVTGRIVKTRVVDGTYYAQNQAEGFDPCGPRQSQAYITQVATRALIFIEADHPGIGLMCFVAVGMAEVSTCDITVTEGQHVRKGEQLGMFHVGGSTHCLVFRPEVQLDFDLHGQTPGLEATNIHVNVAIATLRRPQKQIER